MCRNIKVQQTETVFTHINAHPVNSLTTITIIFKRMRGNLKNWHACISPIICPFRVFLLPWISTKVHPLGARNRSSFSTANAFANSRKPSSKVQKPIFLSAPKYGVFPYNIKEKLVNMHC